MVFLELRRDTRVTTGISAFPLGWPWEAQSSPRVARESWGLRSSHCRAERPHLGVCPGPNIPLQGRQGSRGCIPGSPRESGLVSRGSQDSAVLSSRDAGLLEPPEWLQGSQASSSVWREDSGLLSRPGRKRRRSHREDGGISGVSSSCGARGGFLTRHDKDLRSLSCGTREARSPWARRGGARLCSLVQGGD